MSLIRSWNFRCFLPPSLGAVRLPAFPFSGSPAFRLFGVQAFPHSGLPAAAAYGSGFGFHMSFRTSSTEKSLSGISRLMWAGGFS
jgi:hypothetical protein